MLAPGTLACMWSVLQMHIACIEPEDRATHAANIGDGVYMAAAVLLPLAGDFQRHQ